MTDDTELTSHSDPTLALCLYWLSARLMHYHVHDLRDTYGDMEGIEDAGLFREFQTYFSYWLSALYVVAEGFRELGLKDGIIEALISVHIDELRVFRNATFHFQKSPDKHIRFLEGPHNRTNWAEELHAEFEAFFLSYVEEFGGYPNSPEQ